MITDEMLALAAGEVAEAMAASVPIREHTFSPAFERKMRLLIRRAEHPVGHRLLRQAAAAAAALILAFTLLYAASPTVRAAVNSWIRSTFGSYFQYSPVETTPPDVQYDYALPEEFDGYTLLDVIDNGDGKLYLYVNEQGQLLKFQYIYGGDTSLFLDVEDFQHLTGKVGGYHADIYIAPNEEQNSAIIWYSQENNTLFHISAATDADTLVNLAHSVKIK